MSSMWREYGVQRNVTDKFSWNILNYVFQYTRQGVGKEHKLFI